MSNNRIGRSLIINERAQFLKFIRLDIEMN